MDRSAKETLKKSRSIIFGREFPDFHVKKL